MPQTGLIKRKRRRKGDNPLTVLAFVGPYLLFFLAFCMVPVIMSVVISFLDWDYYTPATFVGWKNYQMIFDTSTLTGQRFWQSIGATFLFVAIQTPLLIIIPFLLAVLLNQKLKGTKFYRALIYFPCILSISTVAIIWTLILDTNLGLINRIFNISIPWLTKQPYAWISIFLLSTWWGLGGNMTLFLAGLQNVPSELFDACEVDGGGFWAKVFNVILPSLAPTFAYVVVMTIISTFNVFGQPLMLTNGGPEDSTTVAVMYIYSVAFGSYKFGRASAMSIILAAIMSVFSVFAYILIKKRNPENE